MKEAASPSSYSSEYSGEDGGEAGAVQQEAATEHTELLEALTSLEALMEDKVNKLRQHVLAAQAKLNKNK